MEYNIISYDCCFLCPSSIRISWHNHSTISLRAGLKKQTQVNSLRMKTDNSEMTQEPSKKSPSDTILFA